MKLRRVMAAAAVAAVVAPVALLSAPVLAFAEDSPSTPASESAPGEPGDTGSAAASDSASPSDSDSTSASASGSASAAASPSGSASASASSSASASAGPSGSAEPSANPSDPDVPYCEDLDENFGDAKVSADVKGLPGKIVAGDGFHGFELVVTNDAEADVEGVAFYAEIENYALDESKYLSPYVDLEFKNPDTGSWDRIGDDDWAGDYFFYVPKLKSGASTSVDLRVSVDAKAPAGDAYSFGSGAYLDKVQGLDCIAEGWAQYDFTVLKAGSSNPAPGTATPGDDGGRDSVKKPQGDVSDLPTGNLADTGTSSALPVIGLVGGVAVVVGAGAVVLVRRRRTGTDS
ncbi:LPXTG cell wall anchor domain-containing protein [Streptomyces sp. NPDC048291]|uniref:LPXTG cell wall anchor domain-containing protein n=1 Tax=Streptomyces sp. NPDC048291 TaxID=3365530 RepID=UPI003722A86A